MPNGPINNHQDLHARLIQERKDLEGDIFEFGVYDGGTTRHLATFNRNVWAFDTYEGIPTEEFSKANGDHDEPGKFKSTAPPEVLFKDYPNIIPIKGRFIKTLSTINKTVAAVFVYMDCDLYESYRQVLEWLPDHLVPGAAIHIDDYQACAGCRKAIDEWVPKMGLEFKDNCINWHGN